MLVRREVESIVEAIDCVGHDESPRHSAVLRLADVLTERVLLQTTLTEHIVARVHGSVIHMHLTADSIELVEDGVDEALLTQSLVPFHVPIVRFAIIGFVVSIIKESVILLRAKPNSTRIICLPSTQSNSIIANVNLPSIVHSTSSFVHDNHHPMNYNLSNLKRIRLNR